MQPFRFSVTKSLAGLAGIAAVSLSALSIARAAAPGPTSTDPILFDSITGVADSSFKFVNESPRKFLGDKVNLVAPGPGPIQLTQIQLGLAHLSGVSVHYTQIQLRLRFYNDGSLVLPDVLQDPATNVMTFDVFNAIKAAAPGSTLNDTLLPLHAYIFPVDLPGTVLLKDPLHVGIAFNFLADKGDGNGLQMSDDLSLVLRSGAPLAVGSSDFLSPLNGFLRDKNNRNDFNFSQTDGSNIGLANSGIAFRLYGVVAVPETGTLTLLGLGILPGVLLLVRYRRVRV